VKFKTDENLPVEMVEILARHGHEALSVIDQSLAGRPTWTSRMSARLNSGRS
jgi:hypothetical protein